MTKIKCVHGNVRNVDGTIVDYAVGNVVDSVVWNGGYDVAWKGVMQVIYESNR